MGLPSSPQNCVGLGCFAAVLSFSGHELWTEEHVIEKTSFTGRTLVTLDRDCEQMEPGKVRDAKSTRYYNPKMMNSYSHSIPPGHLAICPFPRS